MKTITRSVLRKTRKMKLRIIGISLVISVSMAMFIAGIYDGEMIDYSVSKYFKDNKMPDLFYDFTQAQNTTSVENTMHSLNGIAAYQSRLKVGGVYDYKGQYIPTIIIGIPNSDNKEINIMNIDTGRLFKSSGEAVAISGTENYGISSDKQVGFIVAGKPLNFTLTGTVSVPEYMFPSAYTEYGIILSGSLIVIYTDLATLHSYGLNGVNNVIVILQGGGTESTVTQELAPFGIQGVTTQDQSTSALYMNTGANKARSIFPVMGAIFMLVGIVSIFMTMYRLVLNDSRYIGVMMSLGYSRRDIVKSYIALGLVICGIGGAIGMLFTVLFSQGIVSAAASSFKSMKVYYPLSIGPFLIGWVYILASVILSVVIPVLLISRISVREALDYKPKTKVHKSKLVSGNISRVTLIGIRNTTRNPYRTLLTIVVVGITIGTAGAWMVMSDSAYSYFNKVGNSGTWDLKGTFANPINESAINPGFLGLNSSDIRYIIPFTEINGNITKGQSSTGCIIEGCNAMQTTKTFSLKEGVLDFSGAVVSVKTADELSLKTGDLIVIQVGKNKVDLRVTGIVDDMLIPIAYTDRANLSPIFPVEQCNGVFIQLSDNSIDNVNSKDISISALPVISNVIEKNDISKNLEETIGAAISILYVFFILSAFIALVVAASAVIISTMERDVEFATLDSLGAPRWSVVKSILVEMVILAIGSVLVGIPSSYLFGWMLEKALENAIFYFPILFTVASSVIIFIVGFIFIFMSSIVPIRYSSKIDTEKTIRERTAG